MTQVSAVATHPAHRLASHLSRCEDRPIPAPSHDRRPCRQSIRRSCTGNKAIRLPTTTIGFCTCSVTLQLSSSRQAIARSCRSCAATRISAATRATRSASTKPWRHSATRRDARLMIGTWRRPHRHRRARRQARLLALRLQALQRRAGRRHTRQQIHGRPPTRAHDAPTHRTSAQPIAGSVARHA